MSTSRSFFALVLLGCFIFNINASQEAYQFSPGSGFRPIGSDGAASSNADEQLLFALYGTEGLGNRGRPTILEKCFLSEETRIKAIDSNDPGTAATLAAQESGLNGACLGCCLGTTVGCCLGSCLCITGILVGVGIKSLVGQ